jgi:DNA-binding NarL/FixJ family response regulator
MLNIIIADDHLLFREGVKRILSETSDIAVVEEAGNGQELLEKTGMKKYDVILLDISMPGRSGLDVIKQLRSDNPDIPILVLSMHPEAEYAERVLKAGASGYLVKECTPNELIEAIRKVSKGKKYVTPSLAEILACNLDIKTSGLPHEALSDREYEIMCMIASGKTVKEIAGELSLSRKTISSHRAHILEKMGMKNNAQLTHYTIQNHLVDSP